jgi:hypothetical protein
MNLKQGTRVEFDVQTLKGNGTVVGISTTEQPIIGCSYIIEPDESIRSETYDYTHFVAWGTQLKEI